MVKRADRNENQAQDLEKPSGTEIGAWVFANSGPMPLFDEKFRAFLRITHRKEKVFHSFRKKKCLTHKKKAKIKLAVQLITTRRSVDY